MDSKSVHKPKHILKKVKDFESVYDYFSYATTEFGNDKLHYDGYNWTAEELFELYMAGNRDTVMKLAVPESPDYHNIPLLRAVVEPPDQQVIRGKFCGPDMVTFPCKPALTSLGTYFEAKTLDESLLNDPLSKNWWPDRPVDLSLAKLELMAAKRNFAAAQQKFNESLVDIAKSKEGVKHRAERLRDFTKQFNNLAHRNLFKKKESEARIQADLAYNFKKIQETARLKDRIEKLVVVRADLKDRTDKMQMYEDYLDSAVQNSNKKFTTIQQILDRYDVVAYMKKQIVRSHLNDMFEMDVQKGMLMKLVAERKDTVRDFNNQMAELARRYKYVVRRYQHWETAVQRLKRLCNREMAQTQSVEAGIWNLYVQMCTRKRMAVKEAPTDYRAQLAYILMTVKQYEQILQIAQDKCGGRSVWEATAQRLPTERKRRRGEEGEDELQVLYGAAEEPEPVEWESKAVQTVGVCCADAATMIWWEDEVRTQEVRRSTPEDRGSALGLLTLLEDHLMEASGDALLAGRLASSRDMRSLQQEQEDRLLGELRPSQARARPPLEESRLKISAASEMLAAAPVPSRPSGQRARTTPRRTKRSRGQSAPRGDVAPSANEARAPERPVLAHASAQTDAPDTQDRGEQCSWSVACAAQTLDAAELAAELGDRSLAWVHVATAANRRLVGPAVPAEQVCAADDGWRDLDADWFFPPEWRDTLVHLQAETGGRLGRRASREPAVLPTGRRTSAAMRSASTELYASRRSEAPLESLVRLSKMRQSVAESRRHRRSCATRDSLAVGLSAGAMVSGPGVGRRSLVPAGLLDRLSQHEALALTDIGLLQRLQAILADRERTREPRDEVPLAELPHGARDAVLQQVLERVLAQVRGVELAELVTSKREQEWRKLQRREVRLEQLDGRRPEEDMPVDEDEAAKAAVAVVAEEAEIAHDWSGLACAEEDRVDAWTQTFRDQTEDWVQTMPVKEVYGWSQTERIHRHTQTEQDSGASADTADCMHVATQTDGVGAGERVAEGHVTFMASVEDIPAMVGGEPSEEVEVEASASVIREPSTEQTVITPLVRQKPTEQTVITPPVRQKPTEPSTQKVAAGQGKSRKLAGTKTKVAEQPPKSDPKHKSAPVVQRKSSTDCSQLTKPVKSVANAKTTSAVSTSAATTTSSRAKPKKKT